MSLPEDFAAAASSGGLRASVLETYCKLASGGALTSWLVKSAPAFRNRLIADRLFFFKVWAEVAIDSGALQWVHSSALQWVHSSACTPAAAVLLAGFAAVLLLLSADAG